MTPASYRESSCCYPWFSNSMQQVGSHCPLMQKVMKEALGPYFELTNGTDSYFGKVEDVLSSILAKGFILGKDALENQSPLMRSTSLLSLQPKTYVKSGKQDFKTSLKCFLDEYTKEIRTTQETFELIQDLAGIENSATAEKIVKHITGITSRQLEFVICVAVIERFEEVEGLNPGEVSMEDLSGVLKLKKEICEAQIVYKGGDEIRASSLVSDLRDFFVCPKPRRVGILSNNSTRPLRFHISYCENDVDCRCFLQLTHFGENFDSSAYKKTCDNCSRIKSSIEKDVTETTKQLVKLVRLSGQ